ncbi:hypothetical protein SUGI_0656370 [Cryptomeria japonica]|uniref:uncharacterized protein LOC131043646 n=1 Tax=Cryptomeria japonica TaxID=3369 RepID=UPI002414C018|nr:uncharacterized protein LOC131043646 [Cryptomeria japonica]GLJ32629.1 hypothetical protein SUGI_0656370 [Cryptomeria japonica]
MASHGNPAAPPEVQEVPYPDSVGSWGGESEEGAGAPRVRFMCSYGGRILPRPHDNQLRYVGGETRIVAVSRHISYSLLSAKLSKLCGSNVTLKYQLPNEDLDALISVTTEEDLDNMMEEYDRLTVKSSSSSSARLRLFLFPAKLENATSLGSLLEGSKREHWFVDALNGVPILSRGRSEVSSLASDVPDYLFGLDNLEDWDRDERASKPAPANRKSRLNLNSQSPEVHSAPGSPMPESSPYGSTSSAPPCIDSGMLDLPPVKREGFDRQTLEIHEEILPQPLSAVGPQEIGLRTQDPRLVFEDHMTKMIFKPETTMTKTSPEGLTKEFGQFQISREHQESFEAVPESQPATINPAPKSPPPMKAEGNQKDAGQPDSATMRQEGSSSSLASMKREGSGSNLSAYGDDSRNPQQDRTKPIPAELRAEEIYKPPPEMLMQQQPQQYVPEQHYVEYTQAPHFVHPGQMPTAAYWQMHDDGAVPMYFVPAGAAAAPSPVQQQQHLPRQQPAYMPVQRIPASVAYTAPVQGGPPPGPLTQKISGVAPAPYPPKTAGKIPMYRASSRTVAPDPRVMMRPPAIPSSDQYAYAYEAANPSPLTQQMYYTQKATLMNPPYQGVMAPPVTVDLQAAPEKIVEGQKASRVSQSL